MTANLASIGGEALWSCLHDAAEGRRRGEPASAAARLMTADGHVRLGWVVPPPWATVEGLVKRLTSAAPLAGRDRLVLVGAGGWGFAAHALREALGDPRLLPLDNLDPDAARTVLGQAGGPETAGCLAISASRTTIETRLLADTVTAAWQGAPPVWLCEDDSQQDGFPLSVWGLPDQVALFGAPISTAFLAPAAFLAPTALAAGYQTFAQGYQRIGARAAGLAADAAVQGRPRVLLRVPHGVPPGVRLWILQLGRQALCGKSERFRPWVDAEYDDATPAEVVADLDVLTHADPLPRLMGVLYAAAAFIACLGLRAGLPTARHDHVREYKRRVPTHPPSTGRPSVRIDDTSELVALASGWLAERPDLDRLHIVVYDPARARAVAARRAELASRTGLLCEVHEGTAWNHHSYQAVYGDRSVGVVIVVGPGAPGTRSDSFSCALAANSRTRHAIALATHQTLHSRSRLVELHGAGKGIAP